MDFEVIYDYSENRYIVKRYDIFTGWQVLMRLREEDIESLRNKISEALDGVDDASDDQ